MSDRMAICRHKHPDCFALLEDKTTCTALRSSNFKGHDCPFYKPWKQVELERMVAEQKKQEVV